MEEKLLIVLGTFRYYLFVQDEANRDQNVLLTLTMLYFFLIQHELLIVSKF